MMHSGTRLRAPVRGTLAQTPLAHVLVYIRNKRLSGSLELRASGGRAASFELWRGHVVSARTSPSVARFGAVVYELGIIDAPMLDAATEKSRREQIPVGEILLAAGALTSAQHDEVLAEQMRRRVHYTFTFPPDAVFAFGERPSPTVEPPIVVDLLAPVWRGVLDFPPEPQIADVLGRLGGSSLRLVSEAALERAELGAAERQLCEAIALHPMPLDEVRRRFAARGARVDQLVYLLVISKCAERTDVRPRTAPSSEVDAANGWHSFRLSCETPAVMASPSVSSAPARIVGPEQLGVEGIRVRASMLAFESAYEALGLRDGASPEAARAAYLRLSRLWHPEQLPVELALVKGEAGRIFDHVTRAYRAITEAKERAS